MGIENDKLIMELNHEVKHLTEGFKEMNINFKELSNKLDAIKDIHVVETTTKLAVQSEKISRLENLVYGSFILACSSTVALVVSFLKH